MRRGIGESIPSIGVMDAGVTMGGLRSNAWILVLMLALLTSMAGCGTGGGGTTAPPSTPSVAVSITSPAASSANVEAGGTLAIVASVSGTSNTAVTWTVNGVTNGNPTFGTVPTGSGLSMTYTAPNAVPSPATFNITATSMADTTKSASVSVTITAPVAVSITSPTMAQTLAVNATLAVTASVTNTTNTGVTWTVNGVTNGNSTFGTITGSGLSITYTAPNAVPSPATFNISATSVADTTKSASVSVTIESGVTISITSPSTSTSSITVGGTVPIVASVTGTTNTAVTWTVDSVSDGNSTFGTISGSGVSVTYHAPAAIPAGNNPLTITVVSQADETKSASLAVTIDPSTTAPNEINVPGNNIDATGINLNLNTLTPSLGLADIGTCTGTVSPSVHLTCPFAGVAPVTLAQGSTAILWLLGQGLTKADGSAVSGLTIAVSGVGGDITVSQVTALPVSLDSAGLTNVAFLVTVSASAAIGPRNLVVMNSNTKELQAFVGAIEIQGP
jgi:hypothetical protein